MRCARSFIIFLAVAACAFAHAEAYRSDGFSFLVEQPGPWVDPVAVDALAKPAERMGHSLVVRLDNTQIDARPGQRAQYHHRAFDVLQQAGLSAISEIKIPFNPDYQTLVVHRVRVLREGRWLDRLRPDAVSLIQREAELERLIYDRVVTALLVLDDVRVGDTVEYSFTVRGANPVFGDTFFAHLPLETGHAADRISVRLVKGADQTLWYRTHNADVAPEKSTDGTVLRWTLDAVTAYFEEGDRPIWHVPIRWLQISGYDSWEAVDAWARRIYEPALDQGLPDDAELGRLLEGWRNLEKSEAAAQALRYVQENIRYFGVEWGANSHRPSPPAEVLQRRYGDCKDKTTLLIALLRELDIDAWPALVNTRSRDHIAPWLPSPGAFNHVVVMTELNGERYWLDGTQLYQRGTIARLYYPPFGKALVVGRGESGLVEVEVPAGYAYGVRVQEVWTAATWESPVELEITTQYFGDAANYLRSRLSQTPRSRLQREYLNYYAKVHPSIGVAEPLRVHDDEQANTIEVIESYEVGQFWDSEGDRLIGKLPSPYVRNVLHMPTTVSRETPLAIHYPIDIEHNAVMHYPDSVTVHLNAEQMAVSSDTHRFAKNASVSGRTLRTRFSYQTYADSVAPGSVAEFLDEVRQIHEQADVSAVIHRGNLPDGDTSTVEEQLFRGLDRLGAQQ